MYSVFRFASLRFSAHDRARPRRNLRSTGLTLALLVLLGIQVGAQVAVAANGPPTSAEDQPKEEELKEWLITGPVLDYVRAVGERMAKVSENPSIPYRFFVLDDSQVNAFATPNQEVYISRGLLTYMETEDQLASVLGHEIGHIVYGHSQNRRSSQILTDVGAFVLGILTMSSDVSEAAKMYANEALIGKGRREELEADQHGANTLARAGYDPIATMEVMQILSDYQSYSSRAVSRKQLAHQAVWSTHPKTDQRVQQIIGQAQAAQGQTELVEPVADYLEIINGLSYGNSGAEGAVDANRYFHGRLGFVAEFPAGWEVHDSPTKIIAYPPDGATAGFISLEIQNAEPEMTPKEFTEKKLNPGGVADEVEFKVGPEDDQFDAYRASIVLSAGTLGTSQVGALFKDSRSYVFRAETRDPQRSEQLKQDFVYTMEHFRRMTTEDLRMVNTTQRIVTIEAKPGDTYEVLAASSKIGRNAADELRLMNGDFPNGQPRAGDRIKVVR